MKRKGNGVKSKVHKERLMLPCDLAQLRFYVNRYTGRNLKTDRALRYWFSWCEVKPKPEYEWSDLAKLVVFGNFLNIEASFQWAQDKLVDEILADENWFFPGETETDKTIDIQGIAA